MAIPVVDTTQSILSCRQWQSFAFQAAASGTPTLWRITPSAPAGMTFDTATGLLSGAPSMMGVFSFSLEAQNADGWSLPAVFTMAVFYSPGDAAAMAITLNVDIGTRAVTISPPASLNANAPQLQFKYADDSIFKVLFFNGATQVDLDVNSLTFGIKDNDTNEILKTSSSWKKVVTSNPDGTSGSFFYVYFTSSSDSVFSALLDHEQATGTYFDGYGEIEWLVKTSSLPVGPPALRCSSQTFPIRVTRDIIPQ